MAGGSLAGLLPPRPASRRDLPRLEGLSFLLFSGPLVSNLETTLLLCLSPRESLTRLVMKLRGREGPRPFSGVHRLAH